MKKKSKGKTTYDTSELVKAQEEYAKAFRKERREFDKRYKKDFIHPKD